MPLDAVLFLSIFFGGGCLFSILECLFSDTQCNPCLFWAFKTCCRKGDGNSLCNYDCVYCGQQLCRLCCRCVYNTHTQVDATLTEELPPQQPLPQQPRPLPQQPQPLPLPQPQPQQPLPHNPQYNTLPEYVMVTLEQPCKKIEFLLPPPPYEK